MSTFHKPKVFRSANGCCICKAKSSSSRFTDSKRYESLFEKCFDLDEERSGEICNACVLLVKRFLKLPPGSTRNWGHVVDARSGPGIKSFVKTKKANAASAAARAVSPASADAFDTPDKIKKKHVYRRKRRDSMMAPVKDRQRNPSIAVSDFLNMSVWKREKICCGTIFRGPFGEVVIDARFITPCAACCVVTNATNGSSIQPEQQKLASKRIVLDDEDEEESRLVMDEDAGASLLTTTSTNGDVDDEGFFDRPGTGTSPACTSGASSPLHLEMELEQCT